MQNLFDLSLACSSYFLRVRSPLLLLLPTVSSAQPLHSREVSMKEQQGSEYFIVSHQFVPGNINFFWVPLLVCKKCIHIFIEKISAHPLSPNNYIISMNHLIGLNILSLVLLLQVVTMNLTSYSQWVIL